MKLKALIITVLYFSSIPPAISYDPEKLWGRNKNELIKLLKIENYTEFNPADKPDYQNKIVDFFSTMDPDTRPVITIIRISGSPERDFCFFNYRLYSISEEWNDIDSRKTTRLIGNLKEKYAETPSSGNNPELLHSFKKGRTKILVYKNRSDDSRQKIRILYYSVTIFSMLLNQ